MLRESYLSSIGKLHNEPAQFFSGFHTYDGLGAYFGDLSKFLRKSPLISVNELL